MWVSRTTSGVYVSLWPQKERPDNWEIGTMYSEADTISTHTFKKMFGWTPRKGRAVEVDCTCKQKGSK